VANASAAPAFGVTNKTDRWSGSDPADPVMVSPVPFEAGSHSATEYAPDTPAAASHRADRAAALSVSRDSSCDTFATAAMLTALSSAASAWPRARLTRVSIKTPATTRVATVVNQRATGEVPGSATSVRA